MVRATQSAEYEALKALEIDKLEEWELSREVLEQQGVPASAIVIPKDEGVGTLEELQAAWDTLQHGAWSMEHGAAARANANNAINAINALPVILVTSKYHTRRTRLTWQYVSGGRSQPIVRGASLDTFDPDYWWQERRSILAVVREYLGLLNYYAGFPVRG